MKNWKKRGWILGILMVGILTVGLMQEIPESKKLVRLLSGQKEITYSDIEKDMEKYGSYEQIIPAEMDLQNRAVIYENDSAVEGFETNIPSEETLVAASYYIDQQVEGELEAGYEWEDPLVILNPYQISPLTAVILFQTEEMCKVKCTVKGKTPEADVTGITPLAQAHRVPVVGLYPGTANDVELELLDENDQTIKSQILSVDTDPLPEFMTDAIYPVKTSGSSAYGLTIVYGQKSGNAFAYDCMGDIRWYFAKKTSNYGLYLMSNGRVIFQDTGTYVPSPQKPQSTNLYEMDYLGRAYHMYYIAGGNHHEVVEKTPGGNLLLLTSSMDLHYEDVVMEIDRETGEVVNELNLKEIFGTTFVDRDDWAHINTICYDERDNTVMISPRNLESVLKIDWDTHELKWILCDPRFWEGTGFEKYVLQPVRDFTYHFQQHTPTIAPVDLDGKEETLDITMFDNHYVGERKSKLTYYDDPEESYLLVYAINEEEKTVDQIKKIPMILSKITSAAIYDPDSNHFFGMCGHVSGAEDKREGMTYEFDYKTEEILNQFSLKYTFYRAEEMVLNFEDLSAKMEIPEYYIGGELWKPVETEEEVTKPTEVMDDRVSLKLVGSVLRVKTLDHRISQIILKGQDHTYVYDTTSIHLHDEDYLTFNENIPVPLSEMESDTYEIYCVYEGVAYDTQGCISF